MIFKGRINIKKMASAEDLINIAEAI